MDPFPDLATLSDEDLKKLIEELTEEEQEVSYRRRILHGQIDMLRVELVARLKATEGKSALEAVDVDSLTAILAGKTTPPA
jgi:RsiG-like